MHNNEFGQTLRKSLNELRQFASIKHRKIGLSLLRICLGTITLLFYVQHWVQRGFLWGNNGVISFDSYKHYMNDLGAFSLYLISPSHTFENFLFLAGIIVCLMFILGFKTRIASVLYFVFTFSVYSRNPYALDGGDNLLCLTAIYMMFTDCGAYFSIDAIRSRARQEEDSPLIALIHNCGLLAIVIQLSLLYFTSAFYKIQGHMWQDGTALYYILRNSEFNLSPSAHIFYSNDIVVTLLTWWSMLFQMAWPFVIWQKRLRPFVALSALVLHGMIAYFMGILWFSMVMVSVELIIFDDADFLRYRDFVLFALRRHEVRSPVPIPDESSA
jgi:uncharacterized membrane protein YphA (DoxX/SURF4 family)